VAQSTIGFGMRNGPGIAFSSYGDFLITGPNAAYNSNSKGLRTLLDGRYEVAEAAFRATLQAYPAHSDAIYYLGLTLIYEGKREEGFAILKTYRDPLRFRVTSEVQRWAAYLEKKPELTPRKIHEVMNKNRMDAFNRYYREQNDIRRDSWFL